jgi:hypothetical protein
LPDLYLSSAIADWPATATEIVGVEAQGKFEGNVYTWPVSDQRFYHLAAFGPAVTPEVQAKVTQILDAFRSGTIVAPSPSP